MQGVGAAGKPDPHSGGDVSGGWGSAPSSVPGMALASLRDVSKVAPARGLQARSPPGERPHFRLLPLFFPPALGVPTLSPVISSKWTISFHNTLRWKYFVSSFRHVLQLNVSQDRKDTTSDVCTTGRHSDFFFFFLKGPWYIGNKLKTFIAILTCLV